VIPSKNLLAISVMAALTSVLGGVGAEPASADATLTTSWADFDVAPEPVAPGSSVAVSGQLLVQSGLDEGEIGFAGQPVDIDFTPADGGTSRVVTTVVTDADGRFSAGVTVDESGAWNASFAGNEDAFASSSPTDDVQTVVQPPAPPPTTACTGLAKCQVVARSDIDGDKKKDQIGVAITGRANSRNRKIIVRVRTAQGRTLQTTGDKVTWSYAPFHAAAAIDARPGNEIIVGDSMGAHSLSWRIITYRKGALVTLPPPKKSGGANRPSRWLTDSAYSFELGWWRSASSTGSVTLTRKDAVRNDSGKGHTGKITVYRWKSDHWSKRSTRTKHYRDKAAYALGGWHIKRVPTWPAEY